MLEKERLAVVQWPIAAPQGDLLMLNTRTGEVAWMVELQAPIESMAASGEFLAIATAKAIGVLNIADGKVVWGLPISAGLDRGWRKDPGFPEPAWAGAPREPVNSVGGALLIADDLLFCRVGGSVCAYALADGRAAWSQVAKSTLASPLIRCGDLLLVGCWPRGLYAADLHSGRLAWQCDIDSPSRIYIFDGGIYVGSNTQFRRIEPESGKIAWATEVGGTFDQHAALVGGSVVVQCQMSMSVIRADSGQVVATSSSTPRAVAAGDGRAFYGQNKTVKAVDLESGATQWESVELQDPPHSMVVMDGIVACLGASSVTGLSSADGSVVWGWSGPADGGFIDHSTVFTRGHAVYCRGFKWVLGILPGQGKVQRFYPYDVFFGRWLAITADKFVFHDGHNGHVRAFQFE